MLQTAVLQRWGERREDRAIEDGDDFETLTITPEEFGEQITNSSLTSDRLLPGTSGPVRTLRSR